MRICLISREYPPDTGFGGIATFAKHLAVGLTELGHAVEVVALASGQAKTVVQEGVLVHRVEPHQIDGDLGAVSLCMPYSRYVLRTTSALWKKFLSIHNERPFDVIDTPELLAEGLVPAITKVAPLVIRLYTPHSKFIAEKLHNVTPSFDHQFVAMLERVAMLSADVITSPSDDLADFVSRDLCSPREAIRIVRNPIDTDKFTPDGVRALPSDGRFLVMFVGRLEERKGIDYLIESVSKVAKVIPAVRFVVIGDDTINGKGSRSVLNDLKATLRRNGCEQHVEFIPRIPLDELPSYYRSADICIVPSVYDNSPYTCLEAMSCGRPVIGTSSGGTQEYIVHGESGIIIPARDSNSIANALIGLLKDASERQRLGNNARRRVLAKFQRSEIARQTVEIYEQAQEFFGRRAESRLYLRPIDEALPDADALLYSFDKMLYDLLYRISWRFRLKHWHMLASRRPGLFLAKAYLRMAKALVRLSGLTPDQAPPAVLRLEEDIRIKQRRAPEPIALNAPSKR